MTDPALPTFEEKASSKLKSDQQKSEKVAIVPSPIVLDQNIESEAIAKPPLIKKIGTSTRIKAGESSII